MPFVHTSKAVLLHNSLICVGNLTKASFPEFCVLVYPDSGNCKWQQTLVWAGKKSTEADKYDIGLL